MLTIFLQIQEEVLKGMDRNQRTYSNHQYQKIDYAKIAKDRRDYSDEIHLHGYHEYQIQGQSYKERVA